MADRITKHDSEPADLTSASSLFQTAPKPEIPRRATDFDFPRSSSPTPPSKLGLVTRRERNRSPFSRSHLRSKSTASLLTPPAMTRAHSMPAADPSGRMLMSTTSQARPASPLSSSGRYRSPSRRVSEEAASLGVPSLPDIGENVALDPEMENTLRPYDPPYAQSSSTAGSSPYHTFPRRYRPSSPLRSLPAPTSVPSSTTTNLPRTPTSTVSSPLISATKFNEPYPIPTNYSFSFLSSSSIPSTPTSLRSRSPSISSLETIPDSPDAEEAAIEAENMARLRAAVESEADDDSDSSEPRRRSSLEASGGNRGSGFGFTSNQKKKRWSVCGAERRGDLDLETIWED
ncbi:MAG: hypothetical protein M1814_005580 [Vezdaea aestivalis]|nr:MAG: hypothetical protein M1814_005580 [Vezdaea aestivalis]